MENIKNNLFFYREKKIPLVGTNRKFCLQLFKVVVFIWVKVEVVGTYRNVFSFFF